MMTDPVADFCTRIRNAVRVERAVVDIPASGLKIGIAETLKQEGYIYDFQVGHFVTHNEGMKNFEPTADAALAKRVIRLYLKYGPNGERVIQCIRRVSTPGCRIYRGYREMRPVLDGLGIFIVSTNRGVRSDRTARKEKLGGEVLCEVY